MPTKLHKIILVLILIIGACIRCINISSLPSLNPDEAALGYNAYSLIKTGKDEHGQSWPLHFKSFGDYKPGGYVYLAMPFIKVLGLTPLVVRLPNLIFSILTIYILYKLILLLTFDFRLSTICAFVLAVNPWHIHFSRGAWESSTALFFIIFGLYLFYSYVSNRKYYLFLFSCLSFVSSLYVYHSARLISPLIVIFLFISNYQLLIANYKKLLVSCFIAIIFTIPVLVSFLNNGGTTRLGGVGLSADYGPVARAEELLNQHANTKLSNRIIHNRRVLYFISWAQKFISHYDFNFLFVNGDEVPRSRSPDIGQFHIFEFIFLILGILYLLKTNKSKKISTLVFALLLISPIASSLTFQAPSALRSLPLVIPFSILIGGGIYYFFILTKKYFPHNLFLILIFYIYFIFYFIDAYFIHSPKRYPYAWNQGFSDLMPFIDSQKNKFDHIYFTDTYDQPYILYLFFNLYDPSKIQSQIKLTSPDKFGFSTVSTIDNIIFGKIDWNNILPNSLVVAGKETISSLPKLTISFPDGSIGYRIYEK